MSEHRLDQTFKKRLGHGTMPVPEHMWGEIEPFLPGAKKPIRRGLIWIFGAGALLAAIGIGVWMYLQENNIKAKEAADPHIAMELQDSETMIPVDLSAPGAPGPAIPLNERDRVVRDLTGSVDSRQVRNDEQRISSSYLRDRHKSQDVAASAAGTGLIDEQPSEAPKSSSELSEKTHVSLLWNGLHFLPEGERALPDPAKDCYSFGRRGNGGNGQWFAEIYTGPVFSLKSLTSRYEDVSAYIASRDSTESSRLSWHAGLRVGYLHHSGISLRVGGHYTLVNELFDYFDGSTTGVTIRFDTIRDASGNIIDIQADTVIVNGQRIKTTHNRFHTIDIPILLGYQMTQGDWTYGIQAGPVLNVAFRKKGDILSPAGVPVTFSDKASMPYSVFEDHLGLSIFASAHLGKRIGYRTVLYAEPHVHHRLKSITLDSYPIDQRQTNIGLSFGLRMLLN